MTAPRRPFGDPDRPERPAGGLVQRFLERDDLEAARRAIAERLDEPLEEQLADTADGGRTARRRWRSRRAAARRRAASPEARRGSSSSSRAKRSASAVARGSNEIAADRSAVVQRHDDAPSPPPSSTRYGRRVSTCAVARPATGARMVSGCRLRRGSEGSAGRPRSRAATSRGPAGRSGPRSRAGPSGSRSAGRPRRRAAGSRDGTAGRSPLMPAITGDEPPVGERIAVDQPAGERRAEVPGHVPEVAALGVRAVALLADPGGPVVSRCGRWVGRDGTAERVDPRRLVEVAVDDQPAATHRGAGAPAGIEAAASSVARSRVVVTSWVTLTVRAAPASSASGQLNRRPAPW